MSTKNIVFIDERVSGYETLAANLGAETECFLLDARQDGVAQMQRLLADYSALDAIQVISHGSTGTLYLGSTVLNRDNLAAYQTQLQSIGSSLTETGDLLLYGCNVGADEEGAEFVRALANLTGADVAASSDLTGPVALGGDGGLETRSGAIEAKPLSMESMSQPLAVNTAPTFAVGDGRVTTDFGSYEAGWSVIQQADGKLVVAGDSNYDFALARYDANGTLDTSFDGDGRVTTDFGYDENANSVLQQADGKLVVAGGSSGDFALVRYDADGTLDTSFDGDGQVWTDFGSYYEYAHSIIQQADGKLVVAGESARNFALARYNANGTLDSSFDGDGCVITEFDSNYVAGGAYSVIQQADGKLVVAGSSDFGFTLARYNTDGTLDISLDGDGRVTTDFGGDYGYAYSVIQQSDGKLVVAGGSGSDFALARYNPNGTLDTSFDGDGRVTTEFGSGAYAYSVIQQADGKLVVAGYSDGDFALARYNANGTLDATFSPPEDTLDSEPTFQEDSPSWDDDPIILAPRAQIFDAELSASGHYAGASLTLSRHGGASADDVFEGVGTLSPLTEGGYFSVDSVSIGQVIQNSGGTLKLLFYSNATQARVDAALQQLGYANTSDAPPRPCSSTGCSATATPAPKARAERSA